MIVSQEIAGLRLGSKVPAPEPWKGEAEIIGFRHYISRNTGRTSVVADLLVRNHEGKLIQTFEPVEKLAGTL